MKLFRMRKHVLVSLILLGTLVVLLASIGGVHATTITLIKEHRPPSPFTDPSGTYDGYLVGQTITWHIHLNVTSSKAPFPWLSISNLTITDTLPNLGAGTPTVLFVTYVTGSQNSSSAVGAAAFTDFGNGTLQWNFGAGRPFTTGVLAPPPFSSTTEFYTASVTFNATINGSVLDNTFLTNAGVARYIETGSKVHSSPSISDTIWVPRPVLNIVKVNPAKVENGSSFSYVLQLSNTGHEAATGVVVQDIMPTGVTHTPPATATSGSFITDTSTNVTWTGTLFNVTNPLNTVNITIPVTANTPLASVFNSASFIAYPSGTVFTNRSANCTTGVIHAAISLTKTPSVSKIEAGSSVTYNFTVTNTGDTTLTGVNVTDDHLGTIASSQTLTAGQSMSFTKTKTLTANTTNTATATGVDQNGASVNAKATGFVQLIHPAITLTKSPSASKVANGSIVSYTYVVTNTGDASLTVSLTDNTFGTIFSGKVLAAGASNVTIISRVLVANTTNTANATGVDQTGASVSQTATAFVQVIHPAISLTKTADPSTPQTAPANFTYTYVVTNIGDVALSGVTIYDQTFNQLILGPVTLSIGQSATGTFGPVTYPNATVFTNTANATGTDQTGAVVKAFAQATVTTFGPRNLDAEPPVLIDRANPVNTTWDELYPTYARMYNITEWNDTNKDGILDAGDFVGLQVGAPQESAPYWWHVDNVTVTMKVAKWPSKDEMLYLELKNGEPPWYDQVIVLPNGTEWCEVYPQYGTPYRIVKWKDNCDSRLDYCDNVTLLDEDTVGLASYHVEMVKTDLIVSSRTTQVFLGPTKDYVGQGYTQIIPVTIENYYSGTTNFTVCAYYDEPQPIGNQTLTLSPLTSGNVFINWSETSTWPKGTYNYNITINVYADDTLIYNVTFPITFNITIVGDMNGDGKVEMKDIGIISHAFGSSLGNLRYNPSADVNCDFRINMLDIGKAARNFGKTDP